MLGMVILRLCVLEMVIFVESVVVVVITEGVDLIGLSFSGGPYLVGRLQLFSLFLSGVGAL